MSNRPKKGNSKQKAKDYVFSRLASHKLEKGKLRTPLNKLEKMKSSSWRDDHMPLMLWAVLITEVFPRQQYLECFRQVLMKCSRWFSEGGPLEPKDRPVPQDGEMNVTIVIDLETLGKISDELFNEFLQIPLHHKLGRIALRPLLLIKSLPNYGRWRAALELEPEDEDWETLAGAVAATLDHQSERSTDIRWFKLMLLIMAGKLRFPVEMKEKVDEYFAYPNKGDLRSVRPSIRAGEMMIRRNPIPSWTKVFWDECAEKTICMDPTKIDADRKKTALTAENVWRARQDVIANFFANQSATQVDARLDSSFGLVLYALSIVEEIGASSLHQGILGKIALRALVEAAITLKYLAFKDDQMIWKAWRVHGAGQAKLAFLKIQELVGDTPNFYEENELERIANEDQWQEFLDIDLGHWDRTNLRSMAKECKADDIYEAYYAWTSSFSHSHWGSVRDTNFITCHNPLHRLHRIPRLYHRIASSVESDVVKIVNAMIVTLKQLYPQGDDIQSIALYQGS